MWCRQGARSRTESPVGKSSRINGWYMHKPPNLPWYLVMVWRQTVCTTIWHTHAWYPRSAQPYSLATTPPPPYHDISMGASVYMETVSNSLLGMKAVVVFEFEFVRLPCVRVSLVSLWVLPSWWWKFNFAKQAAMLNWCISHRSRYAIRGDMVFRKVSRQWTSAYSYHDKKESYNHKHFAFSIEVIFWTAPPWLDMASSWE